MSRYRWALRPGWILSHVFVLACVAAFLYAGLWQHARLEGRREINAMIAARQSAPAAPIQQVLAPGSTTADLGDAVFRQVSATGTYKTDEQVLVRNRTNHGAPGYWVLTPLVLPDGKAVVVNRGWIPLLLGDAPTPAGYAPPAGEVTVTGLLRATQRQEGLGISDPPDGRLTTLSRVDLDRLQAQVAETLLPGSIDLATQTPPAPQPVPSPIPPPELDDGSHLNYMGQWFIFATLTCIVYPLLLRRTARNKAAEAAQAAFDRDEAAGHDGDGPDGGPGPAPDAEASRAVAGSIS